jgi:hypothetical protein
MENNFMLISFFLFFVAVFLWQSRRSRSIPGIFVKFGTGKKKDLKLRLMLKLVPLQMSRLKNQ